MNILLDWYFNTNKFTHSSKVSKWQNIYIITFGGEFHSASSFKDVLIKSTNNKFLKFLFMFVKFDVKRTYYRNTFSGSKYKKNWKKLYGCTHLAWDVGGGFNREHKYITKVKNK